MPISTPNDQTRVEALRPCRSEAGFTLMEMVVAMMIMLIGLLSLASAIGYALTVSNKGRNVTNTKLLVVSVLEQMETLRNTGQLSFAQIGNVGQVDPRTGFAGFPNGFTPVSVNPGPDGIFGTSDDLVDAGNDGIYGTQDDFTNQALARPGYTREILITSLSYNLKRVQVTLRYPDSTGRVESMVGVGYVNNDANTNFIP